MGASIMLMLAAVCMVAWLSVNGVLAQEKKRATVKCYDNLYKQTCHGNKQNCPDGCPYNCVMDCKTCKPVCPCNKPGSVCQDPRFVGGDGIMFYFHGIKERDFCLVSDSDLHINAHFIGKRGEGMRRDFTWVQSIGVLFSNGNGNLHHHHHHHQLFLGANNTVPSTWDDSLDHLAITLDGKSIILPQQEGAALSLSLSPSPAALKLKISRLEPGINAVRVEVEDKFEITARVVPITEEESRIHKYGITSTEDCFAHLELNFKFYSLSPNVTGVLGQTYGAEYKSPINLGVSMPVVGGEAKYITTSLFATDCKVARFATSSSSSSTSTSTSNYNNNNNKFSILDLNCVGGPGGRGMVCRR